MDYVVGSWRDLRSELRPARHPPLVDGIHESVFECIAVHHRESGQAGYRSWILFQDRESIDSLDLHRRAPLSLLWAGYRYMGRSQKCILVV